MGLLREVKLRRHPFTEDVAIDRKATTAAYLAGQEQAAREYEARVAANDAEARFDRETAILTDNAEGRANIEGVGDLVTLGRYTTPGEAGSRVSLTGMKGKPSFAEQTNFRSDLTMHTSVKTVCT